MISDQSPINFQDNLPQSVDVAVIGAGIIGIEDRVWVKIGEGEKIYPIADEDLERSNAEKTSAVHFMRYQLSQMQVEDVSSGERIVFGVDHSAYPCDEIVVSEETRQSLVADLK